MLNRFPGKIWRILAALPLALTLAAAWVVLCEYVPAWQIAATFAGGMIVLFSLAIIAAGLKLVRDRIRRS
jgi:hypothetical protein